MKPDVEFVGRCDHLDADDLYDFDETSRKITYATFVRKVGGAVVKELNEGFGVPIKRDWHVRFVKGRWQGRPAVCMFHSAYHYIWVLQ